MKLASSKCAFVIVMGVGYAGIASAHSTTGSLGNAAGATDVYKVTCSNDGGGVTHHLVTQVKDNSPVAAPLVSVVTTKGGSTTTSTDTNGDGNTSYSPEVELNKGNGVYTMNVKKSASGAENYTVQFHCETVSDVHTGTAVTQTQNQ